jgi:hypothetical protein
MAPETVDVNIQGQRGAINLNSSVASYFPLFEAT